MKKEYMKPTMRVVKIQHSGIICTSPGGGERDSPAGHKEKNLGNNKFNFKNKNNETKDFPIVCPALRRGAGGVGSGQEL